MFLVRMKSASVPKTWLWIKTRTAPGGNPRSPIARTASRPRNIADRHRRGLFSLEFRLALFHEGLAAFAVVLAVEAGFEHARELLHFTRSRVHPGLADRELGRGHGERRVFHQQLAVGRHVTVQIGDRHDAVK